MRALLRAYHRFGHLVRELMKFGVVGGVAYLVDLTVFNVLLTATDRPLTAKTISAVVATTVAFVGHRNWTFRQRSRSRLRRAYTLFFLFSGIGFGIALITLAVSHYVLGFTSLLSDNIAANVVGLALGSAFRFWAYRQYVFPAVREESLCEEPLREEPVSGDRPPPR